MKYSLAVFGNPIEHSLSPLVFSYFAKQFNINLTYEKILAQNTEDFNHKVTEFFNNNGLSINITSPFKINAFDFSEHKTIRAKFCKASNFIYKNNSDNLIVDTTDGLGLVKDLEINLKYCFNNKRVLIIGSGAVVHSILLDIIVKNPNKINVLARDKNKLNIIINKFFIDTFNESDEYDLIINTTPNNEDNAMFDKIKLLTNETLSYDLSYSKNSLFLKKMYKLNKNIQCANGIGMLVEQAAVCFKTLFNLDPDTKRVIEILKSI